ncbi:MAG: rRNA adenine N-6-methyltransferase family protein [Puniceicoccales bacterium]|jgi:hypothetical protein|nr:rRNA adenine N-6-methyltransferase family protein [Puniceicoccales bacterium]
MQSYHFLTKNFLSTPKVIKNISKDSFAIDIGAHTGDTTVPMAIATGY